MSGEESVDDQLIELLATEEDDLPARITATRPTFEPERRLDTITPASYNPRRLSQEAFVRLQKSIERFGFVKPIIVNGNGIIVAGHQRTKASQALGLSTVPALTLGVNAHSHDEIKFNLLHNSVEESGATVVVPPAKGRVGYHFIDPSEVTIVDVGESAIRISAIYKLLASYGEWGSVVAHPATGRLVLNADYGVACSQLGLPLLVYFPPPKDAAPLVAALSGDYGVYDATQVSATPYVQNVVQPDRLRAEKGPTASATWKNLAQPRLKKGMRVLDFGAGNADYSKRLQKQGYDNDFYEPFFMDRGKTGGFAIRESIKQLRRVAARVEKAGLYDMIVLDSVLNATSDDKYHEWVLRTCAALLSPTGVLCIGTRSLEAEQAMMRGRRATGPEVKLSFVGPDGRGIQMRRGVLYTMKFHTAETLPEALREYFGSVEFVRQESSTHLVLCSKPLPQRRSDLTRALVEEFNPPYPSNYRHGQHEHVVRTILAANEALGLVLEDEELAGGELPEAIGGTVGVTDQFAMKRKDVVGLPQGPDAVDAITAAGLSASGERPEEGVVSDVTERPEGDASETTAGGDEAPSLEAFAADAAVTEVSPV